MFNSNGNYSLADIAAATRNGNDGFFGGGDGSWWIIIFFLFMFCGWGNGFNGFGFGNNGGFGPVATTQFLNGALTRSDLCQDMNFHDMFNEIRHTQEGVTTGFANQTNNLLTGFGNIQSALQSGFCDTGSAITALGYDVQAGINSINVAGMQNTNALQQAINANTIAGMQNTNTLQAQLAEGFCDNRAGQKDIAYAMATDTCAIQTALQNTTRDIIESNNANTRSILDFLVQDKISTLENENQTLKFAASQAAQNNYLVDQLRPCPVPAYITCNPWASNNYGGCSGCGCGSMM